MAEQAYLETLQFRSNKRPAKSAGKNARTVVLDFLDQQIALAEAEIEGRQLAISKSRFVKGADGKFTRRMVVVKPRKYYWQADSEWLVEIRHGNVRVEFERGASTIFAGRTLQALIETLRKIRAGVAAGEADDAITAAAARSKRKNAPA